MTTGVPQQKTESLALYKRVMRLLLCVFVALGFVISSASVNAQTVTQYTINEPGGANDINAASACPAFIVKNFTVGDSFTVSDVDLGVFATHTWRGDIRVTLQSPAGTRVQLVDGAPNNINGDNFNVRLNDEGTQTVNTDGNTALHSATAPNPPTTNYQHNFIPDAALSAFDGQNSLGTWRMEICDRMGGFDDGNFRRADLWLTELPTSDADLSLTKSVSNTAPANGTAIAYTLQVTNAASSPNTATGVVVNDLLPAGVTFVSATGFGTYDSVTGNWTISSVTPGQTRTLTINATVSATSGANVVNVAEVTASSHIDIDSTVNNGNPTEDDYDSASFTVSGARVAGIPPNLGTVCSPANQIIFDWDGKIWTAGTVNNNYTVTGIGVTNYAITTDVAFVAGSPVLNSTNTGGNGAGQQSLFLNMNNNTVSNASTTVLTLPTAVPGLQFTVFDVDFGAGQWADKVTVTGTYNGATVIPTLTNNIANYVVGNTAIGDGASSGDQVNGNVVVTFLSPVDTVSIVYGNHTTAPANPGNQFMNIYDINYCRPATTLSVTKISQVISDPINGTTDPKAIPGATLQYCILISNAGSANAESINATDTIPGNVTYTAASMQSGANCGSAATAEDDDAAGADESDPFGASISGTTLSATAASLGPAEAFSLTFQVTVN